MLLKQKTVEVQALRKWGKALNFIFSDFACFTRTGIKNLKFIL